MPESSETHAEAAAAERAPVKTEGTGGLATAASDYRLPGVGWDYYRQMTHILRYTYEHPDGFVAHFAWEGDDEWRVLNLWRDEVARERFFAEYAADRLVRGIQILGTVTTERGATDVAPVAYGVERLILGPRARAFAGIGEDLDGEAIYSLGGGPVVLEIDIEAMTASDHGALIAEIGYDRSVPVELISHHAMPTDGRMRLFQTWTVIEPAESALETELRPAVERLAASRGRGSIRESRIRPLRRISFDPEIVSAFGF